MTDITARLDDLEARSAIAELIHRYALNIRRSLLDAFEPLFTEDAEFVARSVDPLGGAPVERVRLSSRAEIVAYLGKPGRTGFLVVPTIRNLIVTVDGDRATSSCLMSSHSWPRGAEVFGEYADSFRREDGWRFTRREFTIFSRPAV